MNENQKRIIKDELFKKFKDIEKKENKIKDEKEKLLKELAKL